MPLDITQVEAKPVGLYLGLLAAGTSSLPTPVTVTVGAAGASAGANTIPVTALSAAIPANTVLTFTRAAGSPGTVQVVTTADADVSDTSLAVVAYEGEDGAGIDASLASGDSASWDKLYTVAGTEDSPYSNNPTATDLTAAVYGASSSVAIAKRNVSSMAPSIARTGLFDPTSQLTKDLLSYADTNRNWWCKQVLPDADGVAWATRSGLARVGDLTEPKPANDLIRLNYTIYFISAKPTITYAA